MCGLVIFGLLSWIVGFAWVLPDANRRGQPGVMWAILTLPLGWLAVLAYLITRAISAPSRGTTPP